MKNIKKGIGWTELTQNSSPNWVNEKGKPYLLICPNCKKENYALNVASGICTWCGFDLNKYIKK